MIATSVFLLPNGTFFVELVAVVVILFLMTKYILPPLNKAMEARQEKIRASLEAADAAKAEAAAAGDERQALLTRGEGPGPRDRGRAPRPRRIRCAPKSVGRGQAEYDRIIANANAEVDTARQRAIDEASARIGEVVFELVNQIVGREVDERSHQDLVREAVAALNVEAARGPSH